MQNPRAMIGTGGRMVGDLWIGARKTVSLVSKTQASFMHVKDLRI